MIPKLFGNRPMKMFVNYLPMSPPCSHHLFLPHLFLLSARNSHGFSVDVYWKCLLKLLCSYSDVSIFKTCIWSYIPSSDTLLSKYLYFSLSFLHLPLEGSLCQMQCQQSGALPKHRFIWNFPTVKYLHGAPKSSGMDLSYYF